MSKFHLKWYYVLLVAPEFREVIELSGQLVLELSFFSEVVGVVSVVKPLFAFGQGVEVKYFSPSDISVPSQSGSFDLDELASSEKSHPSHSILQASEVPHSWPPGAVQNDQVVIIHEPVKLHCLRK